LVISHLCEFKVQNNIWKKKNLYYLLASQSERTKYI
jgi:hypothetical protein